MCLIGIAYQVHPQYPIIIAANRDEFYQRQTARASWWQDQPQILGGRDLEANGTWMALHQDGRFGCVTNYRDLRKPLKEGAPSRGELVPNFLLGEVDAPTYLSELDQRASQYNGFNLLLWDKKGLFHYSNEEKVVHALSPGVHGLSNHLLDTPWPKVEKLKSGLEDQIYKPQFHPEKAFQLLGDRSIAPDALLPDTGIGLEWERMLSALFIEGDRYGTRVSSLLLVDQAGKTYFEERSYVPEGEPKTFSLEAATA